MPEKNRFPAVLQPITCFTSKDYGADAQDDLSPTLRAGVPTGSHANAGVPPAVVYGLTTEQTPKFNEDCALTLTKQSPTGGGQPQAVVYSVALRGRDGGGTAELGDDLSGCLRASGGGGDKPHVLAPGEPLPFDTTQITSPPNYSNPGAGAHPPAIAYAIQERAICENPNAGPDGIGVRSDGAAYTLEARAVPQAVCVTDPVTHTLKAEGFDASEDGTGRGQPITVVHGTQDPCVSDIAFAQGRNNGGENALLAPPQMAVRRLMPEECEALQGFPRNWTLVPTGPKRKPAADGPRYKQLGNSMAVPVITWIGRRIQMELDRSRGHNGGPPLDCDRFEDLLG